MASPSFDQIQQPPPPPFFPEIERQDYTYHQGNGSVGPAIGALAVITVLGVMAVMIGRMCSGRKVLNHPQYDFEGWVETKCGSCVDGRLSPPQPPPPSVPAENGGEGGVPGDDGEPSQEVEMGRRQRTRPQVV